MQTHSSKRTAEYANTDWLSLLDRDTTHHILSYLRVDQLLSFLQASKRQRGMSLDEVLYRYQCARLDCAIYGATISTRRFSTRGGLFEAHFRWLRMAIKAVHYVEISRPLKHYYDVYITATTQYSTVANTYNDIAHKFGDMADQMANKYSEFTDLLEENRLEDALVALKNWCIELERIKKRCTELARELVVSRIRADEAKASYYETRVVMAKLFYYVHFTGEDVDSHHRL